MPDDFQEGLQRLSPEELQVLDDVIDNNPQFAAVVAKAWPFMAEAFRPFQENDMDGDQDDMTGGGDQPQPQQPVSQPKTMPLRGPQSALAGGQFRR